jgi:succinoglycan biosynthesis transport protein ExoP
MDAFGTEQEGGARYLQAIREHWLLIVGIVLLALAVATAVSKLSTKRYEARADLLVTPVAADDPTFLGLSVLRDTPGDPNRSILTASRMVQTLQVADGARRRLGTSTSARQLLGSVAVTPVSQANIVTIVGKSSNASSAAAIANAFADETIGVTTTQFHSELAPLIHQLTGQLATIPAASRTAPGAAAIEQRLATLRPLLSAPDPTLRIFSRAEPPTAAAWPRPKLIVGVALVASLLFGMGVAIALELANPLVKREDELLFGQRLPILGRVPRMGRREVRSYLAGRTALPPVVSEAYRILRANLAGGQDGRLPRSILITSASPGDGKTMTAVNLAGALAATGARVILVDADLRRPMIATIFGVSSRLTGFGDVFVRGESVERALVPAPGLGADLQLLLTSPVDASTVDLFEPRRIEQALEQLTQDADVVVVDTPPVTEVADALLLVDVVETVLVSVRLGHTRRDRLNDLRRLLAQRGTAIAGVVVTTNRPPAAHSYYYADKKLAVDGQRLRPRARMRGRDRRRRPVDRT